MPRNSPLGNFVTLLLGELVTAQLGNLVTVLLLLGDLGDLVVTAQHTWQAGCYQVSDLDKVARARGPTGRPIVEAN